MAINKKGLLATLKHPIVLAKVMNLCKDKTDVARYERLLEDDNFLSVEANVTAFRQVIVTDTALWGGDLWLAFLPTEYDDDFLYGWGVEAAYTAAIEFLPCGIRERNPAISWLRHFFSNRTSEKQKIDSACLLALKKSLMPLCNKEDIDKFYEAAEAVKEIPCEAWGDFAKDFYPFYREWVAKYGLTDIMKEIMKEN